MKLAEPLGGKVLAHRSWQAQESARRDAVRFDRLSPLKANSS
jgi:hypothetical protein